MKYDMSQLNVGPADLAIYLTMSGWKFFKELDGRAAWDKFDARIIQPTNPLYDDYSDRISDIVAQLARDEERDNESVLQDISEASMDVLSVRVASPEFEIRLKTGADALAGALDFLSATACSVVEKRRVWSGRKPDDVDDFIKQTLLGPTRPGSYIFTILSPVTMRSTFSVGEIFEHVIHQQSFLDEVPEKETSEPFSRRTLKSAVIAANAALQAAEQAFELGEYAAFDAVVEYGVNSAVCHALNKLADTEQLSATTLETRFTPVYPTDTASTRIAIPKKYSPIFEAAAAHLAKEPTRVNFSAHGRVIAVRHRPKEYIGRVTILAQVEGSEKSIEFTLPLANYLKVAEAHAREKEVGISGTLHSRSGRLHLENPEGLVIYP